MRTLRKYKKSGKNEENLLLYAHKNVVNYLSKIIILKIDFVYVYTFFSSQTFTSIYFPIHYNFRIIINFT